MKINGVTQSTTYYVGNHYEVMNGSATKYYYFGKQRVALKKGGVLSYLHTDHLGSTSVTTNASGQCTSTQFYKPYGEIRSIASPQPCSGTVPTDVGFTGQKRDASSGLMYYGARYYDSALGRFITADTMVPQAGDPQALNRYSYVGNNPLKFTDPSGHCWGAASGARSLPSYDVTCGNLDMALTIVQHPNASGVEKAFAGWYIATEGTAHVALAVGGSILAWKAIVPACADGDCTNEGKSAVEATKSGANALKQNYEHGLKLVEKGQLDKYLDFFKKGMSDASAPSEIPTNSIRGILGKNANIYVVGKPAAGKDLDLIVVGEKLTQLTEAQIQTLNQIAVRAGYTDAHVQFMTYNQAAAFRFATQHDLLQIVENLRNPMLWRLLGLE